jgi:hypothetical protein
MIHAFVVKLFKNITKMSLWLLGGEKDFFFIVLGEGMLWHL